MVSLIKKDSIITDKSGAYLTGEFRGLSTDTKPTEFNGKIVGNGSAFVEINTGKIFFYDLNSQTWKEV